MVMTCARDWCEYLIETCHRIGAIVRAMAETGAKVKAQAQAPAIYSRNLMEVIFAQPYTRIVFLIRAGIAKRHTASRYLKELERIGVLKSVRRWRDLLYLNTALLEALTG